MKAVKNDLNFFKAYKLGPGKHADGNLKGVLALIVIFILAVAVGFAVPFTLKKQKLKEAAEIHGYLTSPEVAELQAELNVSLNKNELLVSYLKGIRKAKNNFENSIIFDSELFDTLSAAMPYDVVVNSISINTQNIQLSCTADNFMSAAIFKQELSETGLFSEITYNGVSQGEVGFLFSMNCVFAELKQETDEDNDEEKIEPETEINTEEETEIDTEPETELETETESETEE